MDKEIYKSSESEKLQDDIPTEKLESFPPSEKLNESIIKYKTPVGKSGPVIGYFPIILSDFQLDINCELKYRYPILSVKSLKSNISLKKLKFLNDNYKLLIEGYLTKHLEIISENSSPKQTTVNIPFKAIVDIKYNTLPKLILDDEFVFKKGYKSKSLFKDFNSLRISWKIESINLFEKVENIKYSDDLIYKIIISFNIILLQDQKIFIPEAVNNQIDNDLSK